MYADKEAITREAERADTQAKRLPRSVALAGFTLIELLLVIGAISLFSTLLLASMSTYRLKARDTVRFNDIRQLQNALELYQVTNKFYPVCNGGDFCDVDCGTGLNADGYDGALYQNLSDFLVPQYMQRMPPKLNNVCIWYWGDPEKYRYILTFKPEEGSNILENPGNQRCYEDGEPWFCVGNNGPITGVGI